MISQSSLPKASKTAPHLITLVLIAGVSAMSMNIFLPSMSSMATFFGVEYSLIQWAVSGYLALTGLLNIIIGPLSDRFGRRRVLLSSLLIFILASLGCVFSQTVETFLVFRMIQAVVASGMVLSRAILRDMVEPDQAASMIGYVTMGMALVPMLAPMLGGVLEEQFGWQASFAVMSVCGMLVLLLVYLDLGETNMRQTSSFKAQFQAYPELLRSRRFWGYSFTAGFATGAFFSFLGGAPYVGTEVFGLSPKIFGFYFGLIPFGYLIGNFITGRFAGRMGIGWMVFWGSVIAALGMGSVVLLFVAGFESAFILFLGTFFVGIGNGFVIPSATSGLLSVKPELAGSAAGLGTATMIGMGSLLSALTGAMLGPGVGAMPMILMMFVCCVLGIALARYTNSVEAVERALKS